MPIAPEWSDLVIRLLCTIAAGALIGFDRGEHGRTAGLRTTLLVSLAACLAMIQTNILMNTTGKSADSFAVMDVMRLPLGILSGMGFIGAGAIIRRKSNILGVTTAATLWFATVLGLCFGGGQIELGFAGLLFGVLVLTGLRPVEARIKQERYATLVVMLTAGGPTAEELQYSLSAQGYRIASCGLIQTVRDENRKLIWHLTWRGAKLDCSIPEMVRTLSAHPGVVRVTWSPRAS